MSKLAVQQVPATEHHWQTLTAEQAARRLDSSLETGLGVEEAQARLERGGANTLTAPKKFSFWGEFFEELTEPMVLMLLVTGVLYAVWGELGEAITIFVIILVLNTIEVLNELRAKKAIAGLRKLAEPTAALHRGGRFVDLPVEQVVPGDVVILRAGRRAPADARLVEAYGLSMDESMLTGESLPVEKNAGITLEASTPLAERRNLVYSGTLVTRGKGVALVTETGMNAEIGKIAGMTRQVKEPRTHLQQMMSELSKSLVWFALGFSALVPLLGILLAHQDPKQMLLTGLSLAFAMIPEELPIIITMVLALGAFRLSQKHAITKRLTAVEALGSVTVIATDKTGTLTENRMEVAVVEPEALRGRILQAGALCNDAVPNGADYAGDPVDAALLRAAGQAGLEPVMLRAANPAVNEFTFDNERRRMSVVVARGGALTALVKGAPEALLPRAVAVADGQTVAPLDDAQRAMLTQRVAEMAADGLRVIALAERSLPTGKLSQDEVESGLTLLGLVGLADPPRPEAREAIASCRRAGIRTLMITGDHPLTAQAIGRQVGLDGSMPVVTGAELDKMTEAELAEVVKRSAIYARTTPEHKYRIVQALQANGERVAVTGDGVNDAPALAAANIGVAMGETGTDIAREAGDMVLSDDNFSTIVNAVQEGRLIFANLQKGVRYYLACKVALLLITLLPTLLLAPVPFAPLQIILMELFMDLMAAASFTAERAETDLLAEPPRDPKEKFMSHAMIKSIVIPAAGLFVAVAVIYLATWYSTGDLTVSQSAAFFGWLIGHVLLAFNMRSERQPLTKLGLGSNRLMLIWGVVVVAFIAAAALIPAAGKLIGVTALSLEQWGLVIGATLVGTFWLDTVKIATYKPKTATASMDLQYK